MPKLKDKAWLDKLMVALSRKSQMKPRHAPLKEQLGVNRGRMLGMPKALPSTRYQQRIAEQRTRRLMSRFGAPF